MSLEARILDTNYHGNTGNFYGNSLYNFSISPGWQKKEKKQPQRIYGKKRSPKITWTLTQIDNFLDHNLHMYQEIILKKYNTVFFRKIFAREEIKSLLVKIFLVKCIIKEMGKIGDNKLFSHEVKEGKIVFTCSDEVFDLLLYAKKYTF